VRTLSRSRFLALLALTVLTMLPVTAVVPVLKPLIADRYGVRDLAASSFMSLNMAGAIVAAPIVGWVSDRRGWTLRLLVGGAVLDAALWAAMSLAPSFAVLSGLRVLEGAAHISVVSLLLATVSRGAGEGIRRVRMAAVGGCVVLGVALGAPLGGVLGRADALLPLRLGALVMIGVAVGALAVGRSVAAPPAASAAPRWPRFHAPPALRAPYLFAFVDRLSVGLFVYAFPMYAARVLGLGSSITGAMIGVFMLPFALLCYPAGRLGARVGQWRLVVGGSAGYAATYAAIPWLGVDALWAAMAVGGVLSAIMFGPTLVLVLDGSTAATRATAMAGFNAAGSVGFLVGPLMAGALMQWTAEAAGDAAAAQLTFGVGAVTQLAAVAWAAWHRRRSSANAVHASGASP
jgi:MFS family permease